MLQQLQDLETSLRLLSCLQLTLNTAFPSTGPEAVAYAFEWGQFLEHSRQAGARAQVGWAGLCLMSAITMCHTYVVSPQNGLGKKKVQIRKKNNASEVEKSANQV